MEHCIFCKIIKGEIPSYKIFENENVFAFLDIHPINPGHILVIPKTHEPDFYNLEEENYSELMKVVKKLSIVIKKTMNSRKVGLAVVGLDVDHAHVHIIPVNDSGDITSQARLEGRESQPSPDQLIQTRDTVIASLI